MLLYPSPAGSARNGQSSPCFQKNVRLEETPLQGTGAGTRSRNHVITIEELNQGGLCRNAGVEGERGRHCSVGLVGALGDMPP